MLPLPPKLSFILGWFAGFICDGAATGLGERKGKFHSSVRVPADPPCAQLWGTWCYPVSIAAHWGPSCWGGEWKHDDRYIVTCMCIDMCALFKVEIKYVCSSLRPHVFHVYLFQRALKDPQSPNLGSRLNCTVSTPSEFSSSSFFFLKSFKIVST